MEALQPPLDLEFLIAEAEALILDKEQAWYVPTAPIAIGSGRDRVAMVSGRKLSPSDRLLDWAERILQKKDAQLYSRIKRSSDRLERCDRWRRITIEFEENEYRALILAMESLDVKVFEQ